jgi:hypothetical protein
VGLQAEIKTVILGKIILNTLKRLQTVGAPVMTAPVMTSPVMTAPKYGICKEGLGAGVRIMVKLQYRR